MKHRILIFVVVSSALFFAACPARATTFQDVESFVAFHVQPVSDTQIILKSIGQWVPLNTPSGYWGPGYYAVAYNGNIRYDFRTAVGFFR